MRLLHKTFVFMLVPMLRTSKTGPEQLDAVEHLEEKEDGAIDTLGANSGRVIMSTSWIASGLEEGHGLEGRLRRRKIFGGLGGRRRRGLGVIEGVVNDIGNGLIDSVDPATTVSELRQGLQEVVSDLPPALTSQAEAFGKGALSLSAQVNVNDLKAQLSVHMSAATEVAKGAAEKADKVTAKIGNALEDAATRLGDSVKNIGLLAAGLAVETWNAIKDMILCFQNNVDLLCMLLLPAACDCTKSSITIAGGSMNARCTLSGTDALSVPMGWEPGEVGFETGDDSSNGKTKLPGKARTTRKTNKAKLQETLKPNPGSSEASCSDGLSAALDGQIELGTTILDVEASANTVRVMVTITSKIEMEAMVEAAGGCTFTGERRFPAVPKYKMACAAGFCILLMVQGLATMDLFGDFTGTAEAAMSAEFTTIADVSLNFVTGQAYVTEQSTKFHHRDGMAFAASANSVFRVGFGPEVTVWPMPGAPVVISPQVTAQIRAHGTILYTEGTSLLQQGSSHTQLSNSSSGCAAVQLNVDVTTDIVGFGLPPAISAALSTAMLTSMIVDAIADIRNRLMNLIAMYASCVPGGNMVTSYIDKAVSSATSFIQGAIPNLGFSFSTSSVQLLQQEQCWELLKSPGADHSDCADKIKCSVS
eukprot:TRINITY_DN13072_c0_g2_i2.p1 TRINITY_DN13072_c0_g2~~TRINITY_DN13072_c0_g2_i2.p1  ORF type:complete len:647 (+),score=134.93 TRINITY_DN13072_c0_g2_i2:57-1997(+)